MCDFYISSLTKTSLCVIGLALCAFLHNVFFAACLAYCCYITVIQFRLFVVHFSGAELQDLCPDVSLLPFSSTDVLLMLHVDR